MPVQVSVDPELCIGSAECVRLLPGAFRIDESRGISAPLPGAAAADPALLLRARRSCPMRAISVDDADGNPLSDAAAGR